MQESTLYQRRERLDKIIDGLGLEDVYGATIERIKAQGGDKSRLGMGALMWISYAERPLTPDELCHALSIELGSTYFNVLNMPSIMTLMNCCQGLITVDKEASTVQLVHFTLREYLSAHPDIFTGSHSGMAEICLTYLNCPQVKVLSADSLDNLYTLMDDNRFLAYCSLYWGVHAKNHLSNCAMSLDLQLLSEYDGHISAPSLVEQVWSYPQSLYTGSPWSGLHCASYFRIAEVVTALMQMRRHDLNEGDYLGCTALSLASEMHEGVVKMLLGQEEVNPDKTCDEDGTPLWYAALNGREGVVKILLSLRQVNPDRPDNLGRTPLSQAAKYGHEVVVKMLLGREGSTQTSQIMWVEHLSLMPQREDMKG